jgi:hypothetical protein
VRSLKKRKEARREMLRKEIEAEAKKVLAQEAVSPTVTRTVASTLIPYGTTTALTAAHQISDYLTDPPSEEELELKRLKKKKSNSKEETPHINLRSINKRELVRKGLERARSLFKR